MCAEVWDICKVNEFEERGLSYEEVEMVLLGNHAPFTWGKNATKAVDNSVALEACAKMALDSLALTPELEAIPQHILDQHYLRKHGPNAHYGQEK